MTDLELAEGLRRRAPDAIAGILERYGNEIQAVAQLILRDRGEAEDVLIETLVTAWQRGPSLRDSNLLRPWLLRIATNHSISLRRRLVRRLTVRLTTQDPAAADHTESSDLRLTLLREVGRLPPRMRAAVVLRYYADLPVEEVSRALGKSPNTVKAQLRVALERFRSALDE